MSVVFFGTMAMALELHTGQMTLRPVGRSAIPYALDYLFHREGRPPGAYTVVPYCDLWVAAHSTGTVDVFETYHATSAGDQSPDDVPEPSTDERMVVLYLRDEQHICYEDRLETLHQIGSQAADSDEARDETIEYARGEV